MIFGGDFNHQEYGNVVIYIYVIHKWDVSKFGIPKSHGLSVFSLLFHEWLF